jgi:hypothetical protein
MTGDGEGKARRLSRAERDEQSRRRRAECRGPDLHLITSTGGWYQLSLDDLPSG